MSDGEVSQAKMREFMSLLPLTLEIAGLPKAEAGRHFNEGQMETRANTVRNAYRIARQLVVDISRIHTVVEEVD